MLNNLIQTLIQEIQELKEQNVQMNEKLALINSHIERITTLNNLDVFNVHTLIDCKDVLYLNSVVLNYNARVQIFGNFNKITVECQKYFINMYNKQIFDWNETIVFDDLKYDRDHPAVHYNHKLKPIHIISYSCKGEVLYNVFEHFAKNNLDLKVKTTNGWVPFSIVCYNNRQSYAHEHIITVCDIFDIYVKYKLSLDKCNTDKTHFYPSSPIFALIHLVNFPINLLNRFKNMMENCVKNGINLYAVICSVLTYSTYISNAGMLKIILDCLVCYDVKCDASASTSASASATTCDDKKLKEIIERTRWYVGMNKYFQEIECAVFC